MVNIKIHAVANHFDGVANMAKVNTRSATKVKGYRVDMPDTFDSQYPWKTRLHFVLRSDGAILFDTQVATVYPNQPLYWGSKNLSIRWHLAPTIDVTKFDLLSFVKRRCPDAVSITES